MREVKHQNKQPNFSGDPRRFKLVLKNLDYAVFPKRQTTPKGLTQRLLMTSVNVLLSSQHLYGPKLYTTAL